MKVSINYGVISIQYTQKHQMFSTKNWIKALKYYFTTLITKGKYVAIADANKSLTAYPTVCTTIIDESKRIIIENNDARPQLIGYNEDSQNIWKNTSVEIKKEYEGKTKIVVCPLN